VRAWLRQIAGLLLPTRCLLCQRVGAEQLCEACTARLEAVGQACLRCGRRRLTAWASRDCGECHGQRLGIIRARSALIYNEAGRALLAQFKYQRNLGAGEALCAAAQAQFPRSLQDLYAWEYSAREPLILPVPMHGRRLRRRRFNHAEFIALRLAAHLGLRCEPGLLSRVKETPQQVGLSANQRRENVRGAFEVRQQSAPMVKGRRVVVVDDLMTTGATLAACAAALRRAGATETYGLTLFSTLSRVDSPLDSLP
jgi:ComF family protein